MLKKYISPYNTRVVTELLSEASSNLTRFVGVRYGFRVPSKSSLKDMYMNSRTQGFGEEVKRPILVGWFDFSSGKYESFYLTAEQARIFIRREFKNAFEEMDKKGLPLGIQITGDFFQESTLLNLLF
jgi:aspartyl-tRNA(Asn)/glutamyl-tRNA(Gln) amidotransferase subunit A